MNWVERSVSACRGSIKAATGLPVSFAIGLLIPVAILAVLLRNDLNARVTY